MATTNPASSPGSHNKRDGAKLMEPAHRNEGSSRTILEAAYCPKELRRGSEPWRFQDFKVQKILGEGAMSTVVQCSCIKTNMQVAVKMYHKERMNSLNIKQVSREIEIHGSLLHPNIIKLYAAFEDGDGIYLVQELAAKGDLYLELSRHGGYMLEAHVVKHVMQPFLAAMTYLHSLGILHRDIKPENVLLGPDGEIKLADFGLAINTSKEKPMSRVGTLDYMPPEIAALPRAGSPIPLAPLPPPPPDGGNYGLPADVWCTGVLAYELLVGGPPFEADTKEATYIRIIKIEPSLPKHLSEAARDFMKKTLNKDPAQRPNIAQLQKHPWLRDLQRARSMHMISSLRPLPESNSTVVAAYKEDASYVSDPDHASIAAVAAACAGAGGGRGSPTAAEGGRALSFGSVLTGRFTPKPSKPMSLGAMKSAVSGGMQDSSLASSPVSPPVLTIAAPAAVDINGTTPADPDSAPGSPLAQGRFDTLPLDGDSDSNQDEDLIPASIPPSLMEVLARPGAAKGPSPGSPTTGSPRKSGMLGMYLKKLSLGAIAAGKGRDGSGSDHQSQQDAAWAAKNAKAQRMSRLGMGSPVPKYEVS